jgi:chromosome segregation ATPase
VSERDEIRQRLDALEAQVNLLTEGQAESRRAADLFAMLDRDVADLKQGFTAQRHVLQALRGTQLEQGQAIGAIVVTLESMQETQRSMQDEMHSMQETQRSVQESQRSMQGDMRSMRETLADHGRVLARLDPGG